MTSLRILWQVHLLHLHVYTCTVHVITLILALHQTWQKQLGYYLPPPPPLPPPPSLSFPSSPSLLSLPPLPPSSPSLLSLPPLPPSPPLPPFPSLLSPSPQSYVFPGMTVINKAMAPLENTTLLTSQYFLCQGMLYACFNER